MIRHIFEQIRFSNEISGSITIPVLKSCSHSVLQEYKKGSFCKRAAGYRYDWEASFRGHTLTGFNYILK